ncbi:MAG: MDR family MFS transporter [Azospirillaceae bacterium]|nr:MDR family MFS transporter [Azospirillaceae bacterium]
MSGSSTTDVTLVPHRETLIILSGLMMVMFLAALDQTIIATALSSMADDLRGWGLMSWVVSAYLVSSTAMTPIYGKLSDIFGRRRMVLTALGVFIAASVLCALSQSMIQLIAARTLQGVGGGGLITLSHTVIADIIAPRQRGRYQGYISSVFAVASVLGPVLGGIFVDHLSWHWIFWINLPLGMVAMAICNQSLKRLTQPLQHHRIDWAGFVLLLASVIPILIGVSQVEQLGGWQSPAVIGPVVLGLVFLALLVRQELRVVDPILPPRLFVNGIVTVASVMSFLVAMVMIPVTIMIPLDYQLARGLSAQAAGLHLTALSGMVVVGALIGGLGTGRTGHYKRFAVAGAIMMTAAAAAIAAVGLGHGLGFDLATTAVLGVGIGLQLPVAVIALQNALNPEDLGIGTSCISFFRSMGGALGVALFSTILIGRLDRLVLAVPGHEVLGADPGLALVHLDQSATTALAPALHAAFSQVITIAFSNVFLGVTVVAGLTLLATVALREIPLRTRLIAADLKPATAPAAEPSRECAAE